MTKKKTDNIWIQSLREMNETNEKWLVPKKGSKDYDLAISIMKLKQKAFTSKTHV